MNFISFVKSPIGTEVFISLILPLITSVLILWGFSKIFKFKKNSFLSALIIGFLVVLVNFQIRFISILLNLVDVQKPPINILAMIISNILLIALILIIYKANWWQTILTWLAIYIGKSLLVMGIFFLLFFNVAEFNESYGETTVAPGFGDFEMDRLSEMGDKVDDNHFKIYRHLIKTPISTKAFSLYSDIAFNTDVEKVRMEMQCYTQEGLFVSSMRDNVRTYEYTSIPQNTLDIGMIKQGYAHFTCAEPCTRPKTIFHPDKLGKDGYVEKKSVARLNTGEVQGTELLFIEKNLPIQITINFALEGKDSAVINCNVEVTSEKPLKTLKKSFTIEYIGN